MTADRTSDLDRVLADIDSLLPPGAPSGDLISPDAMRWSSVDYDDHPATVRGATTTVHTARVTLERTTNTEWQVIEQAARYSGWSESLMRAAIQAIADAYQAQLESLTGQAQHTTSNLQHLRDRHQQAQAVIDARRNRNTGPTNPRGIDGRARRNQHPHRSAACNASPATQRSATPETHAGWWDEAAPGQLPHWSDIGPAWWQ